VNRRGAKAFGGYFKNGKRDGQGTEYKRWKVHVHGIGKRVSMSTPLFLTNETVKTKRHGLARSHRVPERPDGGGMDC